MSKLSARPRSLIASENVKGRSLAHFVLTLRNHVGVLQGVSSLTSKHQVNILSGYHEIPAGSDALWSFFADMTDADVSADQLSSEYAQLPSVLDVKFRASSFGFIADFFNFPVTLNTHPLLMVTVDSMMTVFRHMREMLGEKVACVVIHQMGVSSGEAIYRAFEARFGRQASREELEEFLHLVRCTGWGWETLTELHMETSTAKVTFAGSVECLFFSGSSQPQSQFVRGTYSGFFSGLFGKIVEADEVRCVAKGDSICEFLLKPR
jgi:predicted hydrocarbon binding protein